MSLFNIHKHQWEEIARTYAPPKGNTTKISATGSTTGLAEKMLFGVTTIMWECQICSEIRKEEMLGKEV